MTELLSPAGSLKSLKAAVDAGADAVYIGGRQFSARAYADNPDEEELLEGIRYCHIRSRKCYLTVNTLLKEEESGTALFDLLDPLYEGGLDAVIIQDLGLLSLIRSRYPDLAIHASTQMSVTTPEGAELLMRNGVSRVIPARELSLEEIRALTAAHVEVETFIHGALCYCYSGRCLFSSMLGGRSGNRGRCAQPCRKMYDGGRFPLSMKDLCAIDLLPDLIDAGITSFKIEGRMKKSEYTAGVTAIYRKYLDLCEREGRSGYQVEERDRRFLSDLFNRSGFTDGYYRRYNGQEMLEVDRVSSQRKSPVTVEQEIFKVKINGLLRIRTGEPAILSVWTADLPQKEDNGVEAKGAIPQQARTAAMTIEALQRQIRKTGDTPFVFASLSVDLDDGLFLPLQEINALRRSALDDLTAQILHREDPRHGRAGIPKQSGRAATKCALLRPPEEKPRYTVAVTMPGQLQAVLETSSRYEIDTVYFDSGLLEGAKEEERCAMLEESIARLHLCGCRCFFIFPPVLRENGRLILKRPRIAALLRKFDGYSVHSIDELAILQRRRCLKSICSEEDLYFFNRASGAFLKKEGVSRRALPAELTVRELERLPMQDAELTIYGFQPLMQSAQCLTKTRKGCTGKSRVCYLTDRTQTRFPVLNRCLFCTNTIYNSVPLALGCCEEETGRLSPSFLRLSFTVESEKETSLILERYLGEGSPAASEEGTRGHFKRGVE